MGREGKAKNKMTGQCDARGDEWEEKARKANNKMTGQCDAREMSGKRREGQEQDDWTM